MYRPKSAITQHHDIQHLIYIYFGFKRARPCSFKRNDLFLTEERLLPFKETIPLLNLAQNQPY